MPAVKMAGRRRADAALKESTSSSRRRGPHSCANHQRLDVVAVPGKWDSRLRGNDVLLPPAVAQPIKQSTVVPHFCWLHRENGIPACAGTTFCCRPPSPSVSSNRPSSSRRREPHFCWLHRENGIPACAGTTFCCRPPSPSLLSNRPSSSRRRGPHFCWLHREHGIPASAGTTCSLRARAYLFGCGVTRRYGRAAVKPFGYFFFSSSGSCTVSGMMTSSPSFQLPGVATV